jgi:DNA-binding IclR family transcriptional regulator
MMRQESNLLEQMELRLVSDTCALTKAQAACLSAIRRGVRSKAQIAIAAQLDLTTALRALEALWKLRFARKTRTNEWRPTPLGKKCQVKIIADKKRHARKTPGEGAQRLLDALERPMSGADLAAHLGITKQRVHQLVVRLLASGHLRIGDSDSVLRIIARVDDSTPLLTSDEQRVFSVVTNEYGTTARKIRLAAGCAEAVADNALKRLRRAKLVTQTKTSSGAVGYQVTEVGIGHPQYGRSVERAEPPPLPVRSNRVRDVLALFAVRGRMQITEARVALGISHHSINALVQYLKRKSLIRKAGSDLRSPFLLTETGRNVLAEMCRRQTKS